MYNFPLPVVRKRHLPVGQNKKQPGYVRIIYSIISAYYETVIRKGLKSIQKKERFDERFF